MTIDRDRIYREVLAAVISSKLKSSDLMGLADLLSRDRGFVTGLAQAIRDVSQRFESQQELVWDSGDEAELGFSVTANGLADLAYRVVQRRRMSKEKLVATFRAIAPEFKWSQISRDISVRDFIANFFERASTVQSQSFLSVLGMDVSHDPYLGGISNRPRK